MTDYFRVGGEPPRWSETDPNDPDAPLTISRGELKQLATAYTDAIEAGAGLAQAMERHPFVDARTGPCGTALACWRAICPEEPLPRRPGDEEKT